MHGHTHPAPDRPLRADTPPIGFRIFTLSFATLLAAYCIWLLAADLISSPITRLPTDMRSAAAASERRTAASLAAKIGLFRGDLWSASAYTDADLLWIGSGVDSRSLDESRNRLDRAARFAPTKGAVWLLLAAMTSRYEWPALNPTEALRMSYFTEPSDMSLMPLRALVASRLPALDADMQDLARRDLRELLRHQQKSAVVRAYQPATPAGKRLIEQQAAESDQVFAQMLHRGIE
jgi:hypothetical protein